MPFSEWNLSALTGIGLDDHSIFLFHPLFGFVHGSAASVEAESREESVTGLTLQQSLHAREADSRTAMGSGAFPHAARTFLAQERDLDLDALFEFGLTRFLDGVAVLVTRTADSRAAR